jgi:hypothetical protein
MSLLYLLRRLPFHKGNLKSKDVNDDGLARAKFY